jgi:preprotein translocase subunit SecD
MVAVIAWIDFGGDRTETFLGQTFNFTAKQGLDIQGGYELLLEAKGNANPTDDQMNGALAVIEKRVNGTGANEPVIIRQGSNRILVQLPGVTDEATVRDLIGSTGRLEFIEAGSTSLTTGAAVKTTYCTTGSLYDKRPNICGPQNNTATTTVTTAPAQIGAPGTPGATAAATTVAATTTPATTAAADSTVYQTIIIGDDLDPAKIAIGTDQSGFAEQVNFGVKPGPAQTFYNSTSANVGKYMSIVLDGKVISSAVIQGAISNQGEITNPSNWSTPSGKQEVANIVLQLKYGSLPIELQVISSRKVGATLGKESINKSMLAGVVGLIVVAIFMLLYFRLPGLLADIALGIYAMLAFAVFKTIGITFTLAGIAGFILSIGMAVDANVLIFARMKEELRLGRSIERAVEEGFRNAWPSIRDSNFSTMITCAILYWFGDFTGTSVIKGFSLTLFLGVVCSLVTAVWVSHTFLQTLFVFGGGRNGRGIFGSWWYGMNRRYLANRVIPAETSVESKEPTSIG